MKQEIQKNQSQELSKTKTLASLLQSDMVKKRLEDVLGKRSNSFATSIIQIANSSDLLKKADPQSILNSALVATTLDLPLNNALGLAYIVPFNNKQKDGTYKVEAQLQIGYRAYIQLAQRSGQFKTINVTDVKEGEVESNNRLTGEIKFKWNETPERESLKTIGYVSYFELLNGYSHTLYMSVEEVEAHAKKYSQTYKKFGSGLWKDDFKSMARKTLLKMLLSKFAPLSVEMQQAVVVDQSVVTQYNDDNTIDVDYVDGTDVELTGDDKKEELAKTIEDAKVENPTDKMP